MLLTISAPPTPCITSNHSLAGRGQVWRGQQAEEKGQNSLTSNFTEDVTGQHHDADILEDGSGMGRWAIINVDRD